MSKLEDEIDRVCATVEARRLQQEITEAVDRYCAYLSRHIGGGVCISFEKEIPIPDGAKQVVRKYAWHDFNVRH